MKKILIIVIAVVVLIGIGVLIAKLRGNKTPQIREEVTDQGFNIAQGKDQISGQYIDPDSVDFGVAVYLNATPTEESQSAANYDFNGLKITSAAYKTSDSRKAVENFYKNQFGSDVQTGEFIQGDTTYKIIKSKAGTGPIVNIWTDAGTTYFAIIKSAG